MHSRSEVCRISSSADSCARSSVRRITVPSRLMPLIPADRLSLQIRLPTESLWSSRPWHQPAVRTAGHIFCRPWSRLHRMPVQCVRRRYHRSGLRSYRIQHRMLSFSASHRLQLHSQTAARTLCTLSLCPYSSLIRCTHLQEQYRKVLLPGSRYNRRFSPLHRFHPGLRRVPR